MSELDARRTLEFPLAVFAALRAAATPPACG
jgi:hypothetical protein